MPPRSPAHPLPIHRSLRPAAGWPLRLVARLLHWRQNALSRRQLAQLDGRQLSDAGIDPAQRDAELRKPFWRD